MMTGPLRVINQFLMRKYLRRVILISSASLIFTAVNNSNLGIISQFAEQNDNHWVGPLSIGLLFLGSGLAATYNQYLRKWSYSQIIFTGGLGWDIYCAFSVLFLFIGFEDYVNAIIVIGSLVCGVIVSVFYNGLFNYINQCGKKDKRSQQYFALSLCINQSANLLGNALSALLIRPLGQQIYSLIMLGLSIFSSFLFLLVKEFNSREEGCTLKMNDNSLLSQNSSKDSEDQSLLLTKGEVQAKKIPTVLIFCFCLSGTMISFVFGQFSILFYQHFIHMNKQELNYFTFIVFMVEGTGQFLAGLLLTLNPSKINNIPLAYTLNGFLFLATIALLQIAFQQNLTFLIYIGALLVGFSDCFCFSLALSIGGHWRQSGISLFNTGQSVTVALLSLPTIFLDLPYLAIIYSGIFILSTFSLWLNRRVIGEMQLEHQ